MSKYLKLFFIILIFYSSFVFAKNLGVVGEIYPILEEDFLEFIQKRILTLQQNGEWNRLQNYFREEVKSHTDRPKSLDITKTTQPKEWLFDPSIQLSKDLTDHQGRVFAKRGTVFNPLSVISLKTVLLFLDGDDPAQIKWVKNKIKTIEKPTKLILVKGSISNTEKIFHQSIYFDQAGKLTEHFHIEHVPAIIQQEGLLLKIIEEKLP